MATGHPTNAKVNLPDWATCPRCGHYTIGSVINECAELHAESCEYFVFKETTSRELGWSLIESDSRYIDIVLSSLGVEHKSFNVYSVTGNYTEVYAPNYIVGMINLYHSRGDEGGFADMTLAEFLECFNNEGT